MKRIIIILMLTAIMVTLKAEEGSLPSPALLERPFCEQDYAVFRTPPQVFYPEIWVDCMCGNLSEEGIKADFEAIRKAGFVGVHLFFGNRGGAWPGVEQVYSLSPRWEEIVRYAGEVSDSLGLRLTFQNCPGWAMAGGPWITPDKAMRHLCWTRTDTEGGKRVMLPVHEYSQVEWRDYEDLMVLAFRTPLGDTSGPLVPESVSPSFPEILERVDPDCPHTFDLIFHEEDVIRTVVFPSVQQSNHWYSYDPGIRGWMEAIYPDGNSRLLFDTEWPQSNWQDEQPLSIACDEVPPASRYRLHITNTHADMRLPFVQFFSSARKNNWESEAAWCLRGILRNNDAPKQNPSAYVDEVVDLTSEMGEDGYVSLPEGKWTVMRIGNVNTGKKNAPAPPEATGFECNKYSVEAVRSHFDGYIGRLNNGVLSGHLDGMLMDSWECETQTWTKGMEDEFRRVNGYDLRPWIPALMGYVVRDPQMTSRFLRDWRALINDLVVNNFYGTMTALAHENGLTVTYETAGGDVFPSDIMEYFKFADVPMCEFWIHDPEVFVGTLDFKPIKPTASAGRLYGKPRIAAEAFTSMQQTWDEQLSVLKDNANRNYSEGATYFIYQAYTHNPKPDVLVPGTSFGDGIGTPFLRAQTWWRNMHSFNECTARSCFMLERGKPVSDVLWYLGDEIDHKPHQEASFPDGYKYDYCNPDILLNRLSVENGDIVTPEGIRYRFLWLADTRRLIPETAARILQLVRAGATVVGERPDGIATLSGGTDAERRLKDILDELYGGDIGKGRVIPTSNLDEALNTMSIEPDLTGGEVMWLHRKAESADWYYVCAPKGGAFSGVLSFRNVGYVEIWHPVDGHRYAPRTRIVDGRTEIDMNLEHTESCFVVFHHGECRKVPGMSEVMAEIPVHGPWTLSIPSGWGLDSEVTLNALKPLSELDIPVEARAFSGTMTYRTYVTVAHEGRYCLNLGRVEQIARVILNGVEVADVWTCPYRLDVSPYLRKGENELVIEVTNTWFNRLAYDVMLPENERKTWTTTYPAPESQIRPSGLLGPVFLQKLKEP